MPSMTPNHQAILDLLTSECEDPANPAWSRKLWRRVRDAALRAIRAKQPEPRGPLGRPRVVDRDEVRRLREQGMTQREIAERLGCAVGTVNEALRGE